jgi:plasmid stabilization system protein ParE
MKARISARAQSDLDKIFAFIYFQHGSKAADLFLELARQAAEYLAKIPQAGPHPRWATRHINLRFWVISKTSFLVYYLPDENGVSIERILNGRRDVTRIIENGMEDPAEWE